MRRHLAVLSLAVLWSLGASWAQLVAPNQAGVSMGHVHLNVQDIEAQKKFWIALGATPTKLGTIDVMKFPDGLIFLRKTEPTGGSVGSVVNHVGFMVRNAQESLAKWKAAGLNTEPGRRPDYGYVHAPDDLKIEINEDPSLTIPIAMHHIHFYAAKDSMSGIEGWYVKMFDATTVKTLDSHDSQIFDMPGVDMRVSESPTATVPTKGRVLDHIGFEVKNLKAFCKKLEAKGVKFDAPYRKQRALGISNAFLTDPWGTYIELTEGLNKL
jgi:catechol 2,3-dioxygenase-like lactoylglutathione lyase family enzyme